MSGAPATTLRVQAARLYALTPDAEAERILDLAEAWCEGGVDIVQLRHKTMERAALLRLAERLREVCGRHDVLFIVNDYLDVALLSGADGVHLGEEDLSLAEAEKALQNASSPRIIVGASASSVEVARAAERAGADYVGAGPAYATPIKAEKAALGPEGVRAIQDALTIPVFAIGGVGPGNVEDLKAHGIDRVCVIRALSDVPDPAAEARRLRARLGAGTGHERA
ncbi:MAG: thiamine phosphate synthase [Candidatus Dormibacteraeota bacterium]|nr:thiamine phosphate synthase [Candidatus Dormibacteraeota bacterium]